MHGPPPRFVAIEVRFVKGEKLAEPGGKWHVCAVGGPSDVCVEFLRLLPSVHKSVGFKHVHRTSRDATTRFECSLYENDGTAR